MKKILLLVFACLIIVGCNEKKDENIVDPPKDTPTDIKVGTPIMELEKYKDFNIDDVVSLEQVRYLEAGDVRETYTDKETINSTYQMLSNIKIASQTGARCEDNTTVYNFNTKDGKTYSFEFECGSFIYGREAYTIS